MSRTPTAVWVQRRKGKRGLSYRLRWLNPRTGKWESEACGHDLAYARERLGQIRQELRDGLTGKMPFTATGDFVAKLPTLMAGKSKETLGKTQQSLRELERLCKVGCIAAIDRGVLMEFKAKRLEQGLSAATVNKDVRQIRSALSYAVDAGLLRANPLLRWKGLMLREPEKVVRVIEEEEFTKLLQSCDDSVVKAILVVGYRQALRRKELVHLRWQSIDLQRRILHVVNVPEADELTKSRRNHSMPMDRRVHAVLSQIWSEAPKKVEGGAIHSSSPYVFMAPDGKSLKPDWLTRQFGRLVKKSGIPACTIHDLRRSWSTLAQRAGIDRFTVKDLGGWSSISVVERHYTGDISETHRTAMDKIAGVG